LALTSSSQIFQASSALLPFGPRPPVIAMLEPILISAWALAAPVSARVAAARMAAPANNCLSLIQFPPSFEVLICRQFTIISGKRARG
jgi:hypothetical protein